MITASVCCGVSVVPDVKDQASEDEVDSTRPTFDIGADGADGFEQISRVFGGWVMLGSMYSDWYKEGDSNDKSSERWA